MNTGTVDPNLGQQPTAIVTAPGINWDQAQSRANLEGDAFLNRMCKIHILSGSLDHLGEWWLASGCGTTRDPNLACLFSVRTALTVMGRDTELVLCAGEEPPLTVMEVMGLQQEAITAQATDGRRPDEPVAIAPPATGERSVITQFLQPQIIEMLKTAPLNPVVRTQVHARILVPLPDAADTFEKIKEWIETNVKGRGGPVPAPIPRTRVPVPPPTTQDLIVRVDMSETDTGTAHYTVTNIGSATYRITPTEIRNIVDEVIEDDGGMDEVVEKVDDLARERCSENCPDMAPDEDGYEYSRHNTGEDRYDGEMTVEPTRDLGRILRDWLRANEPELFAQLGDDSIF